MVFCTLFPTFFASSISLIFLVKSSPKRCCVTACSNEHNNSNTPFKSALINCFHCAESSCIPKTSNLNESPAFFASFLVSLSLDWISSPVSSTNGNIPLSKACWDFCRPMSPDLVDLPSFCHISELTFGTTKDWQFWGFVIVLLQVRDFIISNLRCHGSAYYTSPFLMNSWWTLFVSVIKLMEIIQKIIIITGEGRLLISLLKTVIPLVIKFTRVLYLIKIIIRIWNLMSFLRDAIRIRTITVSCHININLTAVRTDRSRGCSLVYREVVCMLSNKRVRDWLGSTPPALAPELQIWSAGLDGWSARACSAWILPAVEALALFTVRLSMFRANGPAVSGAVCACAELSKMATASAREDAFPEPPCLALFTGETPATSALPFLGLSMVLRFTVLPTDLYHIISQCLKWRQRLP